MADEKDLLQRLLNLPTPGEMQSRKERDKKFPNAEGVAVDPFTDPSMLPFAAMQGKAWQAGTKGLFDVLGPVGKRLLAMLGKAGPKATPEGEAAAARFGAGWDQAMKGVPKAFKDLEVKMAPGAFPEAGAQLGASRLMAPVAKTATSLGLMFGPGQAVKALKSMSGRADEAAAQETPQKGAKHDAVPDNAQDLMGTLKKSMGEKPEAKGLRSGIQEAKKGKKGFLKGKEGAQDQAVLSGLIRKMFPGIKDEEIAQLLADTLGGVQIKGGKKFTPSKKGKPATEETKVQVEAPKEISGVPGESGEDSLTIDKEDRNG